jgi:hypothetical protein
MLLTICHHHQEYSTMIKLPHFTPARHCIRTPNQQEACTATCTTTMGLYRLTVRRHLYQTTPIRTWYSTILVRKMTRLCQGLLMVRTWHVGRLSEQLFTHAYKSSTPHTRPHGDQVLPRCQRCCNDIPWLRVHSSALEYLALMEKCALAQTRCLQLVSRYVQVTASPVREL